MVEGRHDLTESQWYGLAPALRTAPNRGPFSTPQPIPLSNGFQY